MKTLMNILYNDADIIVVDKPGGLLSVPGRRVLCMMAMKSWVEDGSQENKYESAT